MKSNRRIGLAVFLLASAMAYILFIALPNLCISRYSKIELGMTKNDVFHKLGMPDFFGPGLDDNWYFVHSGPIIVYAEDVKIPGDENQVAPDFKTILSSERSERVTSIRAKRVWCFTSREALKQVLQNPTSEGR